jgi:hypothetical protein
MPTHTISVTVEEEFLELVSDLGPEQVSSLLNAALRTETERRDRHEALGLWLDDCRSVYGEPTEEERRAAQEAFDELDGVSRPAAQ